MRQDQMTKVITSDPEEQIAERKECCEAQKERCELWLNAVLREAEHDFIQGICVSHFRKIG